MTKIYVVRHAEAEGNLYRRIHGQYDSMLTDKGLLQVKALSKRFADIYVDAVYSSDLTRARQTAEAIYLPKKLPLITTRELREVNMGSWEDKMWGEVEQDEPEQFLYYNTCPDKWDIPGCEHWNDLVKRITGAMLGIARENEGKTVVAVTHGCAIRALQSAVLGVSACDIKSIPYCDNTAVMPITVENGRMTIDYMPDASHLPDELSTFRHETWWKNDSATDGRTMRIDPYNVAANREEYLRRYHEAWVISHGSERGFSDIYYDWAVIRSISDPRAVAEARLGGRPAGMIELAADSGAEENCGHIAFLCMDGDFRGRGFGVQLLGYATSYYRSLGRERLRLRVAEANERAVNFYNKYGFATARRERGAFGGVYVMEKRIALP